MTEEWIRRLTVGVDEEELRALFHAAGLPETNVRDMIQSGSASGGPPRTADPFSSGFRQATIGTVVVLTLAGIAALIGARGVTYNALGVAIGFVFCGFLLIWAIGRLSHGTG